MIRDVSVDANTLFDCGLTVSHNFYSQYCHLRVFLQIDEGWKIASKNLGF